ncbi:hypothetical protein BIWAKO_05963 [Bosea sp. BIWAKO-01]|nr:hypothetical protein BIWAKO_05963 [Bosea sp. BIWAKO-01]
MPSRFSFVSASDPGHSIPSHSMIDDHRACVMIRAFALPGSSFYSFISDTVP